MNYRQELRERERQRKIYEKVSYERRHARVCTPKDIVDQYCKNHPESHIVSFVQEHIPEYKADLFYETLRKMYGEHLITLDTRSLFAIKDSVMNSTKTRSGK